MRSGAGSAPGPRTPPPLPAASQVKPAPATPEEAGRLAAEALRTRYPDLQKERAALGWDLRIPEATAAARALAAAAPFLRPLPDLGVVADSFPNALEQVDPQTFSGVLWLDLLRGPSGDLVGLALLCRFTGREQETRIEIPFDKALPPRPPLPGAKLPEEILWKIPGAVPAAALSDSSDEFWFISRGRVIRRGVSDGKDLQEWPMASPADGQAPCVLRLFPDGEGPFQAGVSTGTKGELIAPRAKVTQPSSSLEGYPLSERESRFIKAPWLFEEGAYALLNYQGREICRFLSMVRIRPASGGSLLVCLKKEGTLGAFSGNSLEPLPPPAEGTFGTLVGWQDLVAATEAVSPYRIHVFRATAGSGWERLWVLDPLPAPPQAICMGKIHGQPAVLALLPAAEETIVRLLPLPKPGPEPPGR